MEEKSTEKNNNKFHL